MKKKIKTILDKLYKNEDGEASGRKCAIIISLLYSLIMFIIIGYNIKISEYNGSTCDYLNLAMVINYMLDKAMDYKNKGPFIIWKKFYLDEIILLILAVIYFATNLNNTDTIQYPYLQWAYILVIVAFGFNILRFGFNILRFGFNILRFGFNILRFGFHLIIRISIYINKKAGSE